MTMILTEAELDFHELRRELAWKIQKHNVGVIELTRVYGAEVPKDVLVHVLQDRTRLLEESAALEVLLAKQMFPDAAPLVCFLPPSGESL